MKLAVCTGTPDIINANVLRKYIHVARVRIVSSFQSPLVANGGYSECIMGWGRGGGGVENSPGKEADLDQYTMFVFYVPSLGLIIVYSLEGFH